MVCLHLLSKLNVQQLAPMPAGVSPLAMLRASPCPRDVTHPYPSIVVLPLIWLATAPLLSRFRRPSPIRHLVSARMSPASARARMGAVPIVATLWGSP